ncbi:MAG: hypothetical protein Q9166_000316 [cf. Caloplaca sp. 2 TL-2023]
MGGGKVPDAWDDDWVQKADTTAATTESVPKPAKLSKAERRAKQAEFNRQLWEDAETQNQDFFLNTRTEVPLKSEFKPAMQVLSRKPAAKPTTSINLASRLGQLSVDDDDDDEQDEVKSKILSAEERQLQAQKERDEKRKKYDEARERLFGSNNGSAGKSLGTTTPPNTKPNSGSRGPSKNRAIAEGRSLSSSGTAAGPARQLYDPNYTAKPDSASVQRENTPNTSGRSTPIEQQPIRNPRGPDGSGRGGFGFLPRGGESLRVPNAYQETSLKQSPNQGLRSNTNNT